MKKTFAQLLASAAVAGLVAGASVANATDAQKAEGEVKAAETAANDAAPTAKKAVKTAKAKAKKGKNGCGNGCGKNGCKAEEAKKAEDAAKKTEEAH